MSGSHAGRRAAVYGASSGMGRATALALARAGADVAVLARSVDALEQVASEIRDAGRHGVVIPVDVQDAAAARASVGARSWTRWAGWTSWCTRRAGTSRVGRWSG